MKKGQTSVGREQAAQAALYGVLAGFILFCGAGGATAAMAASCSDIHCDNPPRDSQIFRDSRIERDADLDADNVTVTSVDHMSSDADLSVSAAALAGSSAPLLYLTPRVASILEVVFDDIKGAVDIADPAIPVEREVDAQPDVALPPQDDLQGSPVAGTGGNLGTNASDRYGPLSSVLDDPDGSILPKLQRQMYRTDI